MNITIDKRVIDKRIERKMLAKSLAVVRVWPAGVYEVLRGGRVVYRAADELKKDALVN